MSIRHLMSTSIILSSFFLAPIGLNKALGHYDPNTDFQLIEVCQYYANHNPQASIPLERQQFLTAHGVDWKHYNYYADCIDQKKETYVHTN